MSEEQTAHPSLMSGRAAQWVGVMMLIEVYGLITLIWIS